MFATSCITVLGVRICSVCLVCISMTFELTGDTAWHVVLGQSAICAMKCEKDGNYGESSSRSEEVSNTSPNVRI